MVVGYCVDTLYILRLTTSPWREGCILLITVGCAGGIIFTKYRLYKRKKNGEGGGNPYHYHIMAHFILTTIHLYIGYLFHCQQLLT